MQPEKSNPNPTPKGNETLKDEERTTRDIEVIFEKLDALQRSMNDLNRTTAITGERINTAMRALALESDNSIILRIDRIENRERDRQNEESKRWALVVSMGAAMMGLLGKAIWDIIRDGRV